MNFLLDTNIVSELRKGRRADPGVVSWNSFVDPNCIWISVIVIGEIRRGIEQKRKKDPVAATHLDFWLASLRTDFGSRILSIDEEIADRWGILRAGSDIPGNDGWIAATALKHKLTVATRNVGDFSQAGVNVVNPFDF